MNFKFFPSGCLLTADGSDDEKVSPEGLKDYQVMPPLPITGPTGNPNEEIPDPAPNPTDAIIEDELFASDPIDEEEEDDVDLGRQDNEADRTIYDELVGRNIRGHYSTGWHVGKIVYFNTHLQQYCIQFDDDSSDYIKKDDIDGLQIILLPEMRVSGRGREHKIVNYKRMADGH